MKFELVSKEFKHIGNIELISTPKKGEYIEYKGEIYSFRGIIHFEGGQKIKVDKAGGTVTYTTTEDPGVY